MNSKMAPSGDDIVCELFRRYPALEECECSVRKAKELLVAVFQRDCKLLVCGNGGSAADAEHIVGELMKSFRRARPIDEEFARDYRWMHRCPPPVYLEGALPALCLVSHTALTTAFSNDKVPVGAFAQQVFGYGRSGDVLFALSTSGRSANVIEAAKVARAKSMSVVALTGAGDTPLAAQADVTVAVPETETFKVQELHLPVYHALCAAVEAELFC